MDNEAKYSVKFTDEECAKVLAVAHDVLDEYIYNSDDTKGWMDYIGASLILLSKFGKEDEARKYARDAEGKVAEQNRLEAVGWN